MNSLKNLLVRVWREEEGVSMLEYALLAALVAVATIGAWTSLGDGITATVGDVTGELGTSTGG